MSDTGLSTTEFTESDITFGPDLQPRPGEAQLSEADAAKILAARFGVGSRNVSPVGQVWDAVNPLPAGGHGVRQGDATGQDLIIHMVRMLPPEYRTASVLSNVDLRPILAELILTESQAARTNTAHYVNGVPVSPDERVRAGEILVAQNKVIKEQALIVAAGMEERGEFATAADRQAFVERMTNGWRGGSTLGPTPELITEAQSATDVTTRDAATAQLEQTSLRDQLLIDAGLLDGTGTPYQYLTEADVQFMFRMNMVDWNGILENEKNKAEARNAGAPDVPADLTVDTGGLIPGATTGPRSNAANTTTMWQAQDQQANANELLGRGGETRIRMLDVMNSLYAADRTPTELQNLQDKLIAAGYLAEDDVRYWGRATDDATIQAWRTLVRDSINMGQDMASLLRDQTLAKRAEDEENAEKAQRDLVLTSSVGIAASADVLGQQILGRKLSGDQHSRLIEFIHNLEREQERTLSPEGAQEAEAVDLEAEVSRWIERENSTEAGSYAVLGQFQQFNEIARGRG